MADTEKNGTLEDTEKEQIKQEYTVTSADNTLESGPYEDGFSTRTIFGAFFVAMIMMPGSVYLGLVAGQSLGPAAEWVTIILFAELARRSFTQLKRQEIFVLFYVASSVASVQLLHLALSGGPLAITIWNQYLVQSPQTEIIANQIPDWVVPNAASEAILNRNLAHKDWWWSASKGLLSPIVLIAIAYVLGRMSWFGFGYIIFRATSDNERLPFPLAPIAAQGATALAEATDREEGASSGKRSWRWTVFSVGATMGIVFGVIYVLVPVVSGLFMTRPVMILPIPFIDFTQNVEHILPASMISISFDAMLFLAGMILPFRLVMGTFSAVVLTNFIINPTMQTLGFFENWTPGNGLLVNHMILSFDFWMSVSIGMAAAVAIIGISYLIRSTMNRLKTTREEREARILMEEQARNMGPDEPPYRRPSKERGDIPIWVALLLFVSSTMGFILVSHTLVPGFPVWIFVIFGFVWSPIHSYISARLIGLTGQGLVTPFLRETVFVTSGYKGVDIWFAPIPLFDHGPAAQKFRELELTRTKFTSIIKAEMVMFPIVIVCSFFFWWFFWSMNQIPSDRFPFATRLWPVAARQAYLIFTANSQENPLLLEALKPAVIAGAGGFGLGIYGVLSILKMPVIFFYGMVGGFGQPLHLGMAMITGALFSKFYFAPKFGQETWSRYVPVVAAGFACGMGLAGMTAVALALIAQSTQQLPF